MPLSRAAAALMMLLAITAIPQPGVAQERRIERLEGTDLPGFDYDVLRAVPLSQCEAACLDDPVCKAYTYNERAQWCFLKSDVGQRNAFDGAISGRVVTATAAAPQAQPLPPPDLGFLPEDVAREAQRLRTLVAASARTGARIEGVSAQEAQQLSTGGAADWTRFARAALARRTSNWQEQSTNRRNAASAAFIALTRATTPDAQAAALATLAQALTAQSMWRPALEAYKASLAIVDDSLVRQAYETLDREQGFRILDYTVDSDAASPRVCIQFSEKLAAQRDDFSKYVTVSGQNAPIVSARDEELCIDGLQHGERYQISLRPGIPAVVGEELKQPAFFTVYVRDRSPSARFPGSDYVLPRVGARGIPIVTVNTGEVAVGIYRIGDRNLGGAIAEGTFRRQLYASDLQELAETRGKLVWSGTMEVERILNREVTTALPIDTTVGDLEPGVYVATVEPRETAQTDAWGQKATQWFVVSDIGLATFSGEDGVHVFARSLATAEPIEGVEIRLLARNDDVLGTATTDAGGHALFAAGLARGTGGAAPAAVAASREGEDYAFLDLTRAGFDLADRGVEGRPPAGPLDAFVYAERGVYRPGETVHLAALLRDQRAAAVTDVPLTLVISRPDGVEYRRETMADAGLGGRTLALGLLDSAMTGTWRVRAYADPEGEPIGETSFLVEDFVPDRIELKLATEARRIERGAPVSIDVDARYLYGAPAAGLALDGELTLRAADGGIAAHPGYHFGLVDDTFTPLRTPLFTLPDTDADGKATVAVSAPEITETTRPLEAQITLRVQEPGGRAVERSLTLPVAPATPMLGVRPLFPDDRVAEGASAAFEVIGIAPSGGRTAMSGVTWTLYRVEKRYQWYRRDGSWSFQPVTYTRRAGEGRLEVGADAPARIETPVEYGRYRLEVSLDDAQDIATSLEFSAGWVAVNATAETPDVLEVALDRDGYAPGETAQLRIVPRFAGTALITVMNERMHHFEEVTVPEGGITVPLEVGDDWAPGAYVTATLYRPMDVGAARMPARAVGLAWAGLDRKAHALEVRLTPPEKIRPRGDLTIPVRLAGLSPGEEAYVTVAAVDVGILNLTGYTPPDAAGWYLGQRRLGVEIRDLYGDLIDSLSATRGNPRSGGDGGGLTRKVSPPTQELVARFSGPVRVDEKGEASVTFDIPAFNGTLRVMAVAWSRDRIGNAAADVIVRDPVVVVGSVPRFLAPGDETRLSLAVDNVDGPTGTYRVELAAEGPLSVGAAASTLTLAAGARTTLELPIRAKDATGPASLELALVAPDGERFEQSFHLPVRAPAPPISRRRLQALSGGDVLTLDGSAAQGFIEEDAAVSVSVTQGPSIDVVGLLRMLDRYPYGCAEQTTSRALPLLYLSEVAERAGVNDRDDVAERIDKAIRRLLELQDANGSFGLWTVGNGDLWLNAYVVDFLTRARERGYFVPNRAIELALDRMQNELSYSSDFPNGAGADIAYALYVLARNGRAAIGDLRYYADEKIDAFGTSLARAQIGAALAFYGDRTRAAAAFRQAASRLQPLLPEREAQRGDYGSFLRDGAAVLAIAAESGVAGNVVPALAERVEAAQAARTWLSTQEAAWLLVAAHALSDARSGLSLELDGEPHDGALYRSFDAAALADAPVRIRNTGTATAGIAVTVSGTPREPLPGQASGLQIERRYYRLDGTEVSPDAVEQNERLVVVLTVTEQEARRARLLLVDMLPGGFEIENPRLVSSADLTAFPWLGADEPPEHAEFRDDRFVAAFDRSGDEAATFSVAYMVRAVSPGRYVHPGASVEDMYRPETFARTAPGTVTVTAQAR